MDEASGAHLKAGVVPHARVAQIPLPTATAVIIAAFRRWGQPQQIKIDNGPPLAHPGRDTPTIFALWCIGLGINIRRNKAARPQENGMVECSQGIMKRWSNVKKQPTIRSLQKRLDHESEFQRNHFRISAKGAKTRKEIYPELYQNQDLFSLSNFKMSRVDDYLSNQVWPRLVKKNGEIKMFSHGIYIAKRLAAQTIFVTFDPQKRCWVGRDQKGTLIKESDKGVPTSKDIEQFAIMSKNLSTSFVDLVNST